MNNIESNRSTTIGGACSEGLKKGEIVMYQPDETIRLEVRVENETVWLNRQQMASLFGRDVKTIGKHINNALKEELANVPTVANFAIVQIEGGRIVNRTIEFYNLDMILSVGYRVKSSRGIKFRRWSNDILKQYLLKGYAVNATSRGDRYLSHSSRHTQVPVPATTTLPDDVVKDQISAKVEDGILTVTMPKMEPKQKVTKAIEVS